MWEALVRKPVELLAGFGLLALGISAPFLKEYGIINSESQWVPVLASLSSAIGGLVIHRALSAAVELRTATQLLQPQLEPNTIQLASIRNQLIEATEGFRNKTIDADAAMFAVKQSTDALQGLVFNYGRVSGAAIAVDLMRETKRALEEMRGLVTVDQSSDSAEMAERLDRIDQRLEESLEHPALAPPKAKKPKVRETIPCPVCDKPTDIQIGAGAGEAAFSSCSDGHKFNAHRDGKGKIFTVRAK